MLYSIGAIQKSHETPNMGQVNNLSVNPAHGFSDVLKAATGTDAVINELQTLGVNITVRAIPNSQEIMRSHANTVSSFGSVTIAPNILEEMANDSEIRQKYVNKIESWLIRGEEHAARVSAMGGRSVHRSMVIHEDGSVTYNSMTVCDPVDEDDDDTCEAIKTENSNFYDKLDYEGAGQHLVIENFPTDNNAHFVAHQFVNLIPHDPKLSRSNRLTSDRYQVGSISSDGASSDMSDMLDSKMASSVMSDSLIRQYQQSLK